LTPALSACFDERTADAATQTAPQPAAPLEAAEAPAEVPLHPFVEPPLAPHRDAEAIENFPDSVAVTVDAAAHTDEVTAGTVGQLIKARGCSTAQTETLNIQLAAEKNCIDAGSFESIADIPNLHLGPAANPFLQAEAAHSLRRIAQQAPGETFQINSSWRSVIQQHILKQWRGSCGIRVVARPGTSDHESGLAMDVDRETTQAFRKALKQEGWTWFCDRTNRGRFAGCKDMPHHNLHGRDLRTLNVLAFQRLWNHSYPDDPIPLSGEYDGATANRMNRTPLAGFPAGTTCDSQAFVAAVSARPEDLARDRASAATTLMDDAPPPAPEFPTLAGSDELPASDASATVSYTVDSALEAFRRIF